MGAGGVAAREHMADEASSGFLRRHHYRREREPRTYALGVRSDGARPPWAVRGRPGGRGVMPAAVMARRTAAMLQPIWPASSSRVAPSWVYLRCSHWWSRSRWYRDRLPGVTATS